MDFRRRQAIFFITLLCGVMNSELIPLNLTRLPTPGAVPLNLTRVGIPGPATLNLTGLPIPGPTPLNLTKVPVPVTLPATDYHVTHFLLALQWPGAYHNQCPHKSREAFLIHGLWPQPRLPNGQHSHDPLKLPKHGALIRNLKLMWPSIIRPCQDWKFWEHEWQFHGAFSNLGQRHYFSKTLELREQVKRHGHDPLTVLGEEGIHPSSSERYTVTRVRGALARGLPGFGKILCVGSRNLSQIYLCVNREASDFIPCPGSQKTSGCAPHIYFLPFDSP